VGVSIVKERRQRINGDEASDENEKKKKIKKMVKGDVYLLSLLFSFTVPKTSSIIWNFHQYY
jgi:uncharacterized protein with WD repeat